MRQWRPLVCCWTACGAILLAGCAGGKMSLPFARQLSSGESKTGLAKAFQGKTNDQLRAEHSQRQLLSHQSPKQSYWKRMLSPEPRVVKASDPVRLASRPASVPAEVHREAARLHEVRGEMDQAVALYQKALAVSPNDEATLLSFARLHDRGGRFDEALKLYRQAVSAHPQSARSHNDLGLCAARQGNMELGKKMLERAVALDSKSVRYRNNLAQVLVSRGEVAKALHHLASVHPPGVAEYNVAFWLQEAGQSDQAAALAARAFALNPSLNQGSAPAMDAPQGMAASRVAAAAPSRPPFHPISTNGGPGVQIDAVSANEAHQQPAPIVSPSDVRR